LSQVLAKPAGFAASSRRAASDKVSQDLEK